MNRELQADMLRRTFVRNNPEYADSADRIDFEAMVDPQLTYSENLQNIERDEQLRSYKWRSESYRPRSTIVRRPRVKEVYNPQTDRMETRAVMVGEDQPRMSSSVRTEYQASRPVRAPLPLPGATGGSMVPREDLGMSPYTEYAEETYDENFSAPGMRYVGSGSVASSQVNASRSGMSSFGSAISPLRSGASRFRSALERRAAIHAARKARYKARVEHYKAVYAARRDNVILDRRARRAAVPARVKVNRGLAATGSAIGTQFGLNVGLPNFFANTKPRTTQQAATRYVKINGRYHALAPRKKAVQRQRQASNSQPIFAGDIGLPNLFSSMPQARSNNPAKARRGAASESFGIPDMFGFGMNSPDMWQLKPARAKKNGRGSEDPYSWFSL